MNGSCNDPTARYTLCPDGAGTLTALQPLPSRATAAEAAKACAADPKCAGFVVGAGVKSATLEYGLAGIGSYTGFASYVRIPAGQESF